MYNTETKQYINGIEFTTEHSIDFISEILSIPRATYLMLRVYDKSVQEGNQVTLRIEIVEEKKEVLVFSEALVKLEVY